MARASVEWLGDADCCKAVRSGARLIWDWNRHQPSRGEHDSRAPAHRHVPVLAMDAACFRRWAKLMHRQSSTVHEDAMIAATALVHDLTVVTRNVRDFSRFDVPVLNPFE